MSEAGLKHGANREYLFRCAGAYCDRLGCLGILRAIFLLLSFDQSRLLRFLTWLGSMLVSAAAQVTEYVGQGVRMFLCCDLREMISEGRYFSNVSGISGLDQFTRELFLSLNAAIRP